MKIFRDAGDRHMFLFLLGEVVSQYDLECYDFCLMDNHFHLSIRNHRSNLSAAMQLLKGEYAACWNVKRGRVGHAFDGPFKDQIVQDERYFRNLTRYIVRNPVRAGMVDAPEKWPWSSYRFHAGLAPAPRFLSTERVLEHFAPGDSAAARAAYIAHIASVAGREREATLFRSRRRVLGDAMFKGAVKAGQEWQSLHPSAASTPDLQPDQSV